MPIYLPNIHLTLFLNFNGLRARFVRRVNLIGGTYGSSSNTDKTNTAIGVEVETARGFALQSTLQGIKCDTGQM